MDDKTKKIIIIITVQMQFCLLLCSSRTVEASQASLSHDTETGSLPSDVSRLRLCAVAPRAKLNNGT